MERSFKSYINDYRYLAALLSMFNFLLTPIAIAITGFSPAYIIVLNFTLVIFASSLIASVSRSRIVTYILGLITLLAIWLEFSNASSHYLMLFRLVSSLLLFTNFCILLLMQLREIKEVNVQFIMLPILGFLFLGIIGGTLFELMYYFDPRSFNVIQGFSGFSFYYFSFISITTVGYGDITPLTAPSQSLTLVLNIIGQFYLAIVIAVFVGKYINEKS